MRRIAVIVETENGRPFAAAQELLAAVSRIAGTDMAGVTAVMPGNDVADAATAFALAAGVNVMAVDSPELSVYNGEMYKAALTGALKELNADTVFALHNSRGMDFAPGLAIRLNGTCLTAVENIVDGPGGAFTVVRAAWNGKLELALRPAGTARGPKVLTVQPGSFKPEHVKGSHGRVSVHSPRELPANSRTLDVTEPRASSGGLTEADIVVAAGRGVGKKENLEMIRKLAAIFPKSAVAGSRPVCDSGWLEYQRQVGITGTVVSPRLYLACGISGARQHTMGMQGAGFIVAISKDPSAAIFSIADVCVVDDLNDFIPALIEAYEASLNGE